VNQAQTFFYVLSVLAILSALGVVLARNVVYAAIYLVTALLMVAGLYVLLFADFLALVQVLIYAGAVSILLLMGLMLTRPARDIVLDNPQKPLAALAAVVLFVILLYQALASNWSGRVSAAIGRASLNDLGRVLFDRWVVPFEIASVLLLVALVGVGALARIEDREYWCPWTTTSSSVASSLPSCHTVCCPAGTPCWCSWQSSLCSTQ